MKVIEYEDWHKEALKRYPDKNIVFTCPVCGYKQSLKELKEAKVPEGSWGFSCIGRYIGGRDAIKGKGNGPCNYAGGGLFQLNPIHVKDEEGNIHQLFDFADDPLKEKE